MEGGVAVTANLPSESGMNNKGLQVHETKTGATVSENSLFPTSLCTPSPSPLPTMHCER